MDHIIWLYKYMLWETIAIYRSEMTSFAVSPGLALAGETWSDGGSQEWIWLLVPTVTSNDMTDTFYDTLFRS